MPDRRVLVRSCFTPPEKRSAPWSCALFSWMVPSHPWMVRFLPCTVGRPLRDEPRLQHHEFAPSLTSSPTHIFCDGSDDESRGLLRVGLGLSVAEMQTNHRDASDAYVTLQEEESCPGGRVRHA